jgi:hypothetical protein
LLKEEISEPSPVSSEVPPLAPKSPSSRSWIRPPEISWNIPQYQPSIKCAYLKLALPTPIVSSCCRPVISIGRTFSFRCWNFREFSEVIMVVIGTRYCFPMYFAVTYTFLSRLGWRCHTIAINNNNCINITTSIKPYNNKGNSNNDYNSNRRNNILFICGVQSLLKLLFHWVELSCQQKEPLVQQYK